MSAPRISVRRRVMLAGAAVCVVSLGLAAAATAQSPDWHGFRRHGGGEAPAMRALYLAQRLAGLEIYLAITPDQQPQWRAFTAALLGMVPDRQPPGTDAFGAIDQITARVQAMAQPAQKLHDAADALKAVLTPDQIGRANAIWASLREHRRGSGSGMGMGRGMGVPHGPDAGGPPGGPGTPPHP